MDSLFRLKNSNKLQLNSASKSPSTAGQHLSIHLFLLLRLRYLTSSAYIKSVFSQ